MSNRLSEAIVDAYNSTNGQPITFDLMLKNYQARMKDPDKDDSISSILKQLREPTSLTQKTVLTLSVKVSLSRWMVIPKTVRLPKLSYTS